MSRSWLIVPLLFLYLFDLGGVGFLSTDEPRYASIGREMAKSGDWVTPRLDGAPWFEKPPLLYWMVAAGHLAKLPDEWAARLPVALLSVGFLLLFYYFIAREFSADLALAATTILATSAGWLAYSFGALTDLPMSAMLGAAMLMTLFEDRKWSGYAAGALLGFAVLAKAFVPIVLFAPVFLIARGKRLAIVVGLMVAALPWHLLCFLRNGQTFWADYFWRQQFSRFFTTERQHVHSWWFYVPVLLAGLFPWTPLFLTIGVKKVYQDRRMRYLGAWLLYGFVFFSASQNKLAGYLLPLMPGLAVVLAVGLQKSPIARWLLAASTASLIVLPTIVRDLPGTMLAGFSRTHISFTVPLIFLAAVILFTAAVWWSRKILITALALLLGIAYFKIESFPELDQRVSVRGFWRAHETPGACIEGVGRTWEYGLNYYARSPLPACVGSEMPRIIVEDGRLQVKHGSD